MHSGKSGPIGTRHTLSENAEGHGDHKLPAESLSSSADWCVRPNGAVDGQLFQLRPKTKWRQFQVSITFCDNQGTHVLGKYRQQFVDIGTLRLPVLYRMNREGVL